MTLRQPFGVAGVDFTAERAAAVPGFEGGAGADQRGTRSC